MERYQNGGREENERIRSQRSGKKSPCRASNAAASITRLVAQVNSLFRSQLSCRALFRWLHLNQLASPVGMKVIMSGICVITYLVSLKNSEKDEKICRPFCALCALRFWFLWFLAQTRTMMMITAGRLLSLRALNSNALRSMEQTARCNSQSIIRALLLDASIEFLTSIRTLYFSFRALFLRLKRKLALLSFCTSMNQNKEARRIWEWT